jgi:hypothetical protein
MSTQPSATSPKLGLWVRMSVSKENLLQLAGLVTGAYLLGLATHLQAAGAVPFALMLTVITSRSAFPPLLPWYTKVVPGLRGKYLLSILDQSTEEYNDSDQPADHDSALEVESDIRAARSLATCSCWASTIVRIIGTRHRVNSRAALINTMPGA